MSLSIKATQYFGFVIMLWATQLSAAELWDIPLRETQPPKTTQSVPHVQLGVAAVPEITAKLFLRVQTLPGVELRETVVSLPGATAFWLDDDLELAHPEVIVGGREFAHVHPDGSLHASLPPKLARSAVSAGWATPHPWSDQRSGWEGFVMLYTPTTEKELEVIFQLVLASYLFITGREIAEQ